MLFDDASCSSPSPSSGSTGPGLPVKRHLAAWALHLAIGTLGLAALAPAWGVPPAASHPAVPQAAPATLSAASASSTAPSAARAALPSAAGELAAGERRVLAWPAEAGDYIEGLLTLSAGRASLHVVDAAGRPQRMLAVDARGRTVFRLVVDEEPVASGAQVPADPRAGADTAAHGGLRLALAASDAPVRFRLEAVQRVARRDQRAPTAEAAALASPTLARLAAALQAAAPQGAPATQAVLQTFWRQVAATGTPLIEPAGPQREDRRLVTFLWRGARHNVRLFGGPSSDHAALARLGDSDVWFRTFELPDTTRLAYQLAPDVPELPGSERERRVAILATAQADPLNPRAWPADAPDRHAQESVLELPRAPTQHGVEPQPGVPRGTLQQLEVASSRLGNRRDVTLYRPAGFDPRRADPRTVLLFVFDAPDYLGKVPTPTILDNLIAARRLPPVVAVFVSNPGREARAQELPGNPDFADFMALELLPRVLQETGLRVTAERTALAGSSYGGLASATVAWRHPRHFGNVISLSGSFWWSPPGTPEADAEHVASLVARHPRQPLRFFLTAGLFESGAPGLPSILQTNRHLRDVLRARDYPLAYREYASGHDYYYWRGALGDGLLALFGLQDAERTIARLDAMQPASAPQRRKPAPRPTP